MVSSISPTADGFRFGRVQSPASSGEWSIRWLLKRNCSLAPRQLLHVYAAVCLLSLGIGAMFWLHGATMVLPFACLEVLALGAAVLAYGLHARDSEDIRLMKGKLVVEHACGRHTDRVEFRPDRVRIEPALGDGSLIELSGQGQCVVVGRFVRPEQRRQVADELRRALRSGPPDGTAPR